jgi:hypothetical protein
VPAIDMRKVLDLDGSASVPVVSSARAGGTPSSRDAASERSATAAAGGADVSDPLVHLLGAQPSARARYSRPDGNESSSLPVLTVSSAPGNGARPGGSTAPRTPSPLTRSNASLTASQWEASPAPSWRALSRGARDSAFAGGLTASGGGSSVASDSSGRWSVGMVPFAERSQGDAARSSVTRSRSNSFSGRPPLSRQSSATLAHAGESSVRRHQQQQQQGAARRIR